MLGVFAVIAALAYLMVLGYQTDAGRQVPVWDGWLQLGLALAWLAAGIVWLGVAARLGRGRA